MQFLRELPSTWAPEASAMNAATTICIVDDDLAARESAAAVAESKGLLVQQYESAEEFLANLKNSRIGCLLLDVRMSGMTGLELQQELVHSGYEIPTIIVSGFGNISLAVTAMQNGAVSFLEKPCSHEELWRNIEVALAKSSTLQTDQHRRQMLRARFARLTANEREVLRRVIEGQPNKLIASDLDIGLRTVELRRSQIMKKVETTSFSELIRLAIEVKFPYDAPPPSNSLSSAPTDTVATTSESPALDDIPAETSAMDSSAALTPSQN